jgi:hypothetical protein
MKVVITDIISQIDNIRTKRLEAERLINNSIMQHRFELLCKELSGNLYTLLFEYIQKQLIPIIKTSKSSKIKLEFLSNKCCYKSEDNKINIYKKLVSDFFLKIHADHKNYIKHCEYLQESCRKLKLFFPSYINILPCESREAKYNFTFPCGIKQFGIYSFSILQPLIITNIDGGRVIINPKLPDFRPRIINKEDELKMQTFYSREMLNNFHKKSYYNNWLEEVAFNFSVLIAEEYNNVPNSISGMVEHLSRREVMLVLRNKLGGVHLSDKSNSLEQSKTDLLFTLFGEGKIMKSLFVSILSIAYEVEYSWKHYVSPLLINKIIR